ncbi:hypothetical protein ACTFIZ_009307 [Dictyostelium cf. discoideum]
MNFPDGFNDWRTYNLLFDIEIPDGCTAEYISDLVESFDKFKSTAMLYASLKPKEDGTYPSLKFIDIIDYYTGEDKHLFNKNIQDLFTINILDLNFPGIKKRTDIPTKKKEEK